MKNLKVKIINLVDKITGTVTGKEEVSAVNTLKVLSNEARNALRKSGVWNQDFHRNEIVATIAVLSATRKVLKDKEKALGRAILFIGEFENIEEYKDRSIKALSDINVILGNEKING